MLLVRRYLTCLWRCCNTHLNLITKSGSPSARFVENCSAARPRNSIPRHSTLPGAHRLGIHAADLCRVPKKYFSRSALIGYRPPQPAAQATKIPPHRKKRPPLPGVLQIQANRSIRKSSLRSGSGCVACWICCQRDGKSRNRCLSHVHRWS